VITTLRAVVGARARRVERAELTEELETRAVELELVLRGRGLALESRSLLGLGPDASPQPLDTMSCSLRPRSGSGH